MWIPTLTGKHISSSSCLSCNPQPVGHGSTVPRRRQCRPLHFVAGCASPHLNEPPAAPQRGGEKTCRSCWNVVASLRSHNNTLSDLNSDLMPDDPQHTAVFLSGVAALRAELGGPVSFQKVKHLLIKQVTLLVRDTRQHEVKRPFRPLAYRHIHSSTSKKIRIVVNHIGCKEPSVGINSSSWRATAAHPWHIVNRFHIVLQSPAAQQQQPTITT